MEGQFVSGDLLMSRKSGAYYRLLSYSTDRNSAKIVYISPLVISRMNFEEPEVEVISVEELLDNFDILRVG